MFAWHNTPWMWLSMLVLWSVFAVFVYYAFVGRTRPTVPKSGLRAAEILDERYARGDISAEQYRERRETLEATRTPMSER